MYQKEKAATEEQHKFDLLNNQVQTQQQTMQFIGSEIHDSVAQKLTLASIYSQQMEFENTHPELLGKISNISNIINDSLNELRDLAKTLSNTDIQEEGLINLLNKEAGRVNDTGICRMEVIADSDNNINMNKTAKSFLLRVLQEFIQNSLKHAGCSMIKIVVSKQEDGISIIASDNGKGFDDTKLEGRGMGLNNMKRRIQLIDGNFSLQSSPGNGTTLKLYIQDKKLIN
ncbi:MAG: ATP-binding protein [Agriterribacter sp.]